MKSLSFVAVVPPKDIALSKDYVTVSDNSVYFTDPENAEKTPLHYQFHKVLTDFSEYFKYINNSKNHVFVTIYTTENPVTQNFITANLQKYTNKYKRENPKEEIKLQVGNGSQNDKITPVRDSTEAVNVVHEYLSTPNIIHNSVIIIRFCNKPAFCWFILPFALVNEVAASSNFLNSIRKIDGYQSREYEIYQKSIKDSLIVLCFMFSAGDTKYKIKKNLFKLIRDFGGVPITDNTKKAAKEEKVVTQIKNIEIEDNWNWKEFILEKKKKGHKKKKPVVDKQRLVYVAQKAASAINTKKETMEEILNVMDEQIQNSVQFERNAYKRVDDLNFEFKNMTKEKNRVVAIYNQKRQEYLKIHKENDNRDIVKRDEKIGFDDDVDFTIEILESEIEAAQKEIEYLKTAFEDISDLDEDDDEDEDENEEEEIEEEEAEEDRNDEDDQNIPKNKRKMNPKDDIEDVLAKEKELEHEGNEEIVAVDDDEDEEEVIEIEEEEEEFLED